MYSFLAFDIKDLIQVDPDLLLLMLMRICACSGVAGGKAAQRRQQQFEFWSLFTAVRNRLK